jgi:hypothetical protein
MLAEKIDDLLQRVSYATAGTVGCEWDRLREEIVAGVREIEERVDVLESIHTASAQGAPDSEPIQASAAPSASPAAVEIQGSNQPYIDKRSREYRESIGRTGKSR